MNLYECLHNNYALKFGVYIARIMEYEVYSWDDPFTHRNERQKMNGSFYVHRSKKGKDDPYRQGTFKGIDIVQDGGILVRSILVSIPSKGGAQGQPASIFYEGPSVVVDAICSLASWTLGELESSIQLIPCIWKTRLDPIIGSRVGLTLRRAPEDRIDEWAKALIAPMRSCIFIPSKGKETLFVVDVDRKDVPRHTPRYWAEYDEGSKAPEIVRDMTALQIAGFFSK